MSNSQAIVNGNLRKQMSLRGVSQMQLGEALGLPQTAISRRLRGLIPWTLPELEAASQLLGLSLVLLVPDGTESTPIGA